MHKERTAKPDRLTSEFKYRTLDNDCHLSFSCSNDDLITELEFTVAISRLSKDTVPGPDKVKYSDIKKLSAENKSELFRLYEESFSTGQVHEDWSHSYLKPILKLGKDHSKLNGYRILTMQNTTGMLMERIVARKLAHDLERRKVLPPYQGECRAGKNHLESTARLAYDVYEGFQRKEQTLAMAVDLEDACNRAQSAIWRQLDAHKIALSSTPGKEDRQATWKLDLHAPITDDGFSTRLSPVPCPLQCLHNGPGRSKQQWFKLGAYACS